MTREHISLDKTLKVPTFVEASCSHSFEIFMIVFNSIYRVFNHYLSKIALDLTLMTLKTYMVNVK